MPAPFFVQLRRAVDLADRPRESAEMTDDFAEAERRIARGAGDAHDFNLAAWHRAEAGDIAGAFALLDAVLAASPNEPATLVTRAALLRRAGRLRDAVLACDAAIRAAPSYPDAWLERAFVLAAGGSMKAAGESYVRVLALDPANPAAHAGLASLAARDGDAANGREHAQAALAADPGNAIASAALATIELEGGNPNAARALLAPLAASLDHPTADRALVLGLLGDAHDKLGEPAPAFTAYARAKQDFATINAHHFAGRQSHRDFVEGILAGVEAMDPACWSPADPCGQAATHLFLLGYPRSGNTLVENVLASLPDVVALEERPTLRAADQDFLADPGGLGRFAALGEEALAPYRGDYWNKVAQAGIDTTNRCFVDMDPLKGIRLPLIARLFPQARILIMRRDPRDVVWSCFRTQFALTNAAMDFTTLERAARHYDAMMRLLETAQARLPLAFHVVRYESLVADFDAETRALCAFAGLPWDPAVRRFDRTAKARGVATASAGQVRKGLYDGRRQWEPFAPWLEPVMPILAPWIDKFGYAA